MAYCRADWAFSRDNNTAILTSPWYEWEEVALTKDGNAFRLTVTNVDLGEHCGESFSMRFKDQAQAVWAAKVWGRRPGGCYQWGGLEEFKRYILRKAGA